MDYSASAADFLHEYQHSFDRLRELRRVFKLDLLIIL